MAGVSADHIARLDSIRAELDDIARSLPLGDAQMCLFGAKDSIAMAQDLMEAEEV